MTSRVEPCPVVHPNSVHDERVSFPFSDGIAEPCGVHVFWMTAPVRVDDAKRVLVFKKDGRYGGGLNDLKRHDAGLNPSRGPNWQALRQGIVDLVLLRESRCRVRCERRLMPQRFRDVWCEWRRPNSIQVGRSCSLGAA